MTIPFRVQDGTLRDLALAFFSNLLGYGKINWVRGKQW